MAELTPHDEEVLVELLLEWEDSQESPEPKSAEDLCGPRRDLLAELRRRIDELGLMNRLMIDPTAKTRLMDRADYYSIPAPDCPRIAGFRVLGEIGRGGMGIVYKAIQLNLKRPVALKLINGMSQNPKVLISRLRDEAEALGKLNHEHVIRVYDVIDREGMVCLVLEYVDGTNLAQRDSGSSIDAKSAAWIALTVATTMSDVHQAGLLHRDIKPGNLLRDSRGRIKISDFGLAKHLAPNSMMSLTTQGVGSPSYMAPEQAIGVSPNIGEWTDVYGIGATLFDLITGRPPFLGATHLATLDQVRHNDPISPRLLVPDIPKDLETICLKCLSKEPLNRYASAAALASDLKNFLEGRPIMARPLGLIDQTWRWMKRNPDRACLVAAIAMGFVMAVGLGAWEITRINSAAIHARTQEFYLTLSEITDRSLRTPAAWSWKNLDELKHAVSLRPKDDAAALYRLRSETTKALAAFDARKQRELLHGFDPYAIEFNPDGSILAVGANADTVGIVNVALIDTTTWETAYTLTFKANEEWVRDKPDGVRSMVFSPDGKELYVGSRSGEIYVFDSLSKQHVRYWKAHAHYIFRMRFSSDSKSLITCSKDGSIKKWSLDGSELAKIQGNTEFTDFVILKDIHSLQSPIIAVAGRTPLWLSESDFSEIEPSQDLRESWKKGYEVAAHFPDGGGWVRDAGETFEVLDSHRQESIKRIFDVRSKFRDLGEQHGIGISPDGRWFVSSNLSSAKLWDLAAGERVSEIPFARGRVTCRFHPTQSFLVLGGDLKLQVYELTTESVWKGRLQQPRRLQHVTLSTNGRMVGAVRVANLSAASAHGFEACSQLLVSETRLNATYELSTYIGGHGNPIQCLPDSRAVCLGWLARQTLQAVNFDRTLGFVIQSPEISDAEILRFSPDGKQLYFTAQSIGGSPEMNDRQSAAIKVLEIDALKLKTLWVNSESERTLRVSRLESLAVGAKFLACASLDGSVRILDPELGTVLAKVDLKSVSDTVSLAPDERSIVAGTRHGDLLVLNVPSGTVRQTIHAHEEAVTAVTFAGSDLVISGSRDRKVKLWQMQKDGMVSEILALGPLSDQVKELAASDDGNVVAVLVDDETAVRILRVDLLRERLSEYGLDW